MSLLLNNAGPINDFEDHLRTIAPPSTPPQRTPPILHGIEGPPTLPSTPVVPGQEPVVLFGFIGGGDSLSAGLERSSHSPSSPLRQSSRRLITDARRNATSLGSPIRLRQQGDGPSSGSRRALARAAPPPMPLWQYPTLPRKSRTSLQETTVILEEQTSYMDTPLASLEEFKSPPTPGISSLKLECDRHNEHKPAGDDLPAAIAMAVLAAIGDAVKGKHYHLLHLIIVH